MASKLENEVEGGNEPRISPAWEAALHRFERELKTRGSSPHTLRAYGGDLAELAAWASRRGMAPGELAYRDLRSYAAALSERGLARSSVARKLAAVRSLHDNLVRTGSAAQNPAELLPSLKRRSRLPRVLGPDEIASLLDRIPASGPLEVRDRALFELAYACGLRAEEIVKLDLDAPDFDS
jgi:site-specific recombinase XerD